MIAAHTADDALLARPAQRVVVEPDDLRGLVVGLRAGIGEQHLAEPLGHDLEQFLGGLDAGLGRAAVEHVVGRQLLHLTARRLDEALLAEAERGAPEPGHAFEVTFAGLIIDIDPLTAGHDDGTVGLVLLEIGIGMDQGGDIARRQGVGDACHGDYAPVLVILT